MDLPSTVPNYAPPALDAFGAGCANSAEFWAASQAAPLRRDIINGSVVFQDYCANDNYASGGFLADSQVTGDLDFYGNQQYMVRNSAIGGVNGCPGWSVERRLLRRRGRPGAGLLRAVRAEHRPGR